MVIHLVTFDYGTMEPMPLPAARETGRGAAPYRWSGAAGAAVAGGRPLSTLLCKCGSVSLFIGVKVVERSVAQNGRLI